MDFQKVGPGPGSYEIRQSRPPSGGRLSQTGRSSYEQQVEAGPGPGAYSGHQSHSRAKGGAIARTTRLTVVTADNPLGPGQYFP